MCTEKDKGEKKRNDEVGFCSWHIQKTGENVENKVEKQCRE